jgi:hypothetical protein
MHESLPYVLKSKGDIKLGAENKFLLLEKTANLYIQLITHVFISFLSTFNFSFRFPCFALKYPFTAYSFLSSVCALFVQLSSRSQQAPPPRQRLDILCVDRSTKLF